MKKSVKVMSIILIIMIALTTISTVCFADTNYDNALNKLKDSGVNDKVMDYGGTIVGIVRAVGIVAAVVILMVVGIKYMKGSAEEKAEYKKTMPAYIIGAILLFAATQVIAWIIELSQGFN